MNVCKNYHIQSFECFALLFLANLVSLTAAPGFRVSLSVSRPQGLKHFQTNAVQNLKLPVWPVHAGVIAQVFDWLGQPDISEKIISTFGGRVVPIQMGNSATSPFLLLAHHSHSFTPFDPIRALTTLILPEGFPAHPHAGFSTLTYCIEGGLRHRDSEGLKMAYGDGDVQWMRAGRGTIHEEMWDIQNDYKRIEIFQLWVNSPRNRKFSEPQVQHHLSKDVVTRQCFPDVSCKIICGEVVIEGDEAAPSIGGLNEMTDSPIAVMHLSIGASKKVFLAADESSSFVLYVRKGSLVLTDSGAEGSERVRMGDMVVYSGEKVGESANERFACLQAGPSGLDCLLLLGKPINESVVMGGPLVMATEQDYQLSASYFQAIGTSAFWPQSLDDDAWRRHVSKLNLQGIIQSVIQRE